jgi:hypothetical protein
MTGAPAESGHWLRRSLARRRPASEIQSLRRPAGGAPRHSRRQPIPTECRQADDLSRPICESEATREPTPSSPQPAGIPVRSGVTLDADDIDAVAARVVELLREQPNEPRRYVDAATLARALSVECEWVYLHARELGALRLGDGPKARLRFDLERARAALVAMNARDQPPPDKPPRRRRGRPRERAAPTGVQLIQGRASQ